MSDTVVNVILTCVCVMCAGLASGLTQGLLSLSHMDMEIKKRTGTDIEKAQAEKVLPLLQHHHLLLVSLLLWNATAMEALPLYLDKLVPEFVAIILSVTLVLVVGEIIPAAIMTGPHQLLVVTSLANLVYFILLIFFPIAYPISLVLDVMLGKEEGVTTYNRVELRTMVRIQHEFLEAESKRHAHADGRTNPTSEGQLHLQQINMIDSVLKFRETVVRDVMTEDVFMLSLDDLFSFETLNLIFRSGYSRIPVFEKDRNDVVGLILAKDLLFIDPEDELPVRSFMTLFCRPIHSVWPDDRLTEVLSHFKRSRGHMAIVRDVNNDDTERDPFYEVKGIITLEDVFEKILGEDIMDETDVLDENNQVVKDKNRDVGMSRMRLLNPAMINSSQRLSREEVKAISAHLHANVPGIYRMFGDNPAAVEEVVANSVLVERRRTAVEDEVYAPEDQLYQRGSISNLCILVLTGKLTVFAGKDGFKVDMGPWSSLGQDSLTLEDDCFVPDFSAFISSPEIKYLRLSKRVLDSTEKHLLPRRRSTFKEALDRQGPAIGGSFTDHDRIEASDSGKSSLVPSVSRNRSFSIRRRATLKEVTREIEGASAGETERIFVVANESSRSNSLRKRSVSGSLHSFQAIEEVTSAMATSDASPEASSSGRTGMNRVLFAEIIETKIESESALVHTHNDRSSSAENEV